MSVSLQDILILAILCGFGAMEWITHRYQKMVHPTRDDSLLELLMFVSLIVVTQPLIVLIVNALCQHWLPAQRNLWAAWPWWAMVGVLLVADDLTQYLWHRASHSPLLWPLHRAHHSALYMSIRVTYRNNFFYYLMMPGLWIGALLLYLGFGKVYGFYLVIKLLVIMGAHCTWAWDERLYRIPALRPVMWVLERTISTPATHWAHHAMTNADGIGNYKGNFGNLLFFWDVLLGSAHITRRYPPKVGLRSDERFGQERWYVQMFYPLLQSKRSTSSLRFGSMGDSEDETRSDTNPPVVGSAVPQQR